ncbi:sulfite exporter TauE/SafE family protein [Halorientalis litorea]|uniref:sulfite exporter TauE/SafE family protein n=1 Tax=Halorientalis litorea TaxID=2931977 RepID=UPI0035673B65
MTVPASAFTFAPRLELAVFGLVGLLGGAHCLGMCGPLVTVYADRVETGDRLTTRAVRQHFLFNTGRTVAYATLGAVMGLFGSLVYDAAGIAQAANGVRGVVGVVVGALVVGSGLSYLRGGAGGPLARLDGGSRAVTWLTRRVDRWVRGPRILGLGAVHAFLPCPLLYPAYLYALARGDPVEGAVALGVLGLGTFPSLLFYGTVLAAAPTDWLRRVHRGLGVAFVALGYLPLSHGLALLGLPVPLPPVHDVIYQPIDAFVDVAQYCLP